MLLTLELKLKEAGDREEERREGGCRGKGRGMLGV
jgi:hypothetical protein